MVLFFNILFICLKSIQKAITVESVLSGHSKEDQRLFFQDGVSLNAGQKDCRMLQESILQYFRPALSLHLSFRTLFFPIFEWPLKTGLTNNNFYLNI